MTQEDETKQATSRDRQQRHWDETIASPVSQECSLITYPVSQSKPATKTSPITKIIFPQTPEDEHREQVTSRDRQQRQGKVSIVSHASQDSSRANPPVTQTNQPTKPRPTYKINGPQTPEDEPNDHVSHPIINQDSSSNKPP